MTGAPADSHLAAIPSGDPIPHALANGSLLKRLGSAGCLMEGGLKRCVINPTAMEICGHGWDAVHFIPRIAILDTADCPEGIIYYSNIDGDWHLPSPVATKRIGIGRGRPRPASLERTD